MRPVVHLSSHLLRNEGKIRRFVYIRPCWACCSHQHVVIPFLVRKKSAKWFFRAKLASSLCAMFEGGPKTRNSELILIYFI